MKNIILHRCADWKKTYLLWIILLLFSSCSKHVLSLRESLCPQIIDAYDDGNWNRILLLVDSLNANNENVEGLYHLYAEALAATQQTDKAIEVLNDIIKKEPENYYAIHTLGDVYWIKKDYDNAIHNFEKAVEINSAYARPYLHLAEIYKIQKDNNNAIDNYLKAIRLFAENNYFEEVKQYTRTVLKLDSTNIDAYKYLSYAFHEENDYRAVVACLMEVLRLATERNLTEKFYETCVFLGEALYEAGEYESAIYLLELANNDTETLRKYGWLTYCYLSAAYNKLHIVLKSAYYQDLAEKIDKEKTERQLEFLKNWKEIK